MKKFVSDSDSDGTSDSEEELVSLHDSSGGSNFIGILTDDEEILPVEDSPLDVGGLSRDGSTVIVGVAGEKIYCILW